MGNSINVDEFINSLGLGNNRLAKVLIKNQGDCNDFFANFLGRGFDSHHDLIKFREFKIERDFMTFNQFQKKLKENNNVVDKAFLEDVFLQPISEIDFEFIKDRMEEDGNLINNMYFEFSMNPHSNVLRYVI